MNLAINVPCYRCSIWRKSNHCNFPIWSNSFFPSIWEPVMHVLNSSYTHYPFPANIFLLLLSADSSGIDAGGSEYDKVWSRSNGQFSSWGFATKALNMSLFNIMNLAINFHCCGYSIQWKSNYCDFPIGSKCFFPLLWDAVMLVLNSSTITFPLCL